MSWWSEIVERAILLLARRFPKRYRLIPRLDGAPLLRQFLVLRLGKKVEIFLQSFVNGETEEWFHLHRWNFMASLPLSGKFCEERYPGNMYLIHRAGRPYFMDRSTIHRLAWADPQTWTLFFAFQNEKDWGYVARPESPPKFTSWDRMIRPENRVKSL